MIPPNVYQVDGIHHELVRAWPRSASDVPLELVDDRGVRIVGRWLADPRQAASEVRRTAGSRCGDDPRLMLQPAGIDRKLPALAGLVASGGQLVAHRPNRRAVVRTRSGSYLKITRPGRAPQLAVRHALLASALEGCARVPDVRSLDDDRLELGPLPGRQPLEVDERSGPEWERHWQRVGTCLAALAATVASPELPVHDAQREADVTLRWVERAVAANRLPATDVHRVLAPLIRRPAPATTLAHRDLHDGQLLFTDGPPGVIDPDTLARAEPALDLANLLVHLDLRVAQGDLHADERDRAREAVLRGASPAATTLGRLPSYEQATRLRLSAVYAFRPRWHALARRWFGQLVDPRRRPDRVS